MSDLALWCEYALGGCGFSDRLAFRVRPKTPARLTCRSAWRLQRVRLWWWVSPTLSGFEGSEGVGKPGYLGRSRVRLLHTWMTNTLRPPPTQQAVTKQRRHRWARLLDYLIGLVKWAWFVFGRFWCQSRCRLSVGVRRSGRGAVRCWELRSESRVEVNDQDDNKSD